jgi:carboxylesterase
MPEKGLGGKPVMMTRGRRALLFIHGFTAMPHSLLPVAEKLAAAGLTVSLPLLPGHGTTPEDMATHASQDWLDAALAAWDQLAAVYPNPAVAGLSMGAALALYVASNRPAPAVAALAPALYLRDWRLPFVPIMKYLAPWKQGIGNDIKGKRFSEKTYPRYRLKNIQDLLKVMKTVRPGLARLTTPLLGIQSYEDHVIPPSCLDDLMRWAGSHVKENHRLKDSYHVITMDNEYLKVTALMGDFFARHMPAVK